MNCQLASTNIFLGGQMQWDLVVGSAQDELYIQEFHLSPISEYLNFQYSQDSDLLNYKHLENIKRFYKRLGKSFFRNSYNPKLDTLYPSFFNESDYTYENTYHCGTKRISYNRYKKQFSALCPVWIEDLFDDNGNLRDISFDINIFSPVKMIEGLHEVIEKKSILKKRLYITSTPDNDVKKYDYHNKFSNYFKEYLSTINLDDNLCSIDYTSNECRIKGINVETGTIQTKDTSYVLDNILERERPLLEFNSLLTQQFASNKVIARQLFNFNIIFNIDDLLSPILLKVFTGNVINSYIEVTCNIGGDKLDFRDFYTNHEYIDRLVLNKPLGSNITGGNCLDYLQDYKCIDLIDKNKISPQICHWSLLDNNDYVFQLYDGFAPISCDESQRVQLSHRYYNMPDIWSHEYTKHNNTIGWCNVITNAEDRYNLNEQSTFEAIHQKVDEESMTTFDLSSPNFYAQSIRYTNEVWSPEWFDQLTYKIIKCCILFLDKTHGLDIFEKANYIKIADDIFCKQADNKLFIMVNNYKEHIENNNLSILKPLVYKNFIKLQLNQNLSNLKILQASISNPIYPKFIFFKKGISINAANRPVTDGGNDIEIQYYKDDKFTNKYLIRYDGKIRPCLIDVNKSIYYNYIYSKLSMDDKILIDIFNKYIPSGFNPLYPSIRYFSINTGEFISDNDFFNVIEYDDSVDIIKGDSGKSKKLSYTHPFEGYCYENEHHKEYKWFNFSRIYNLIPIIEFDIIGKYSEIQTEDVLMNKIRDEFFKKIDVKDNKEQDFIYKQYDVHYEYDYNSNTDVDNMIYKVILKLK